MTGEEFHQLPAFAKHVLIATHLRWEPPAIPKQGMTDEDLRHTAARFVAEAMADGQEHDAPELMRITGFGRSVIRDALKRGIEAEKYERVSYGRYRKK